jgi:hypothetical protein
MVNQTTGKMVLTLQFTTGDGIFYILKNGPQSFLSEKMREDYDASFTAVQCHP